MGTHEHELEAGTAAAAKFAPPLVTREDLAGGGFVLRSPQQLKLTDQSLSGFLAHWAEHAPNRPYLMERGPDGSWQGVTFSEAYDAVLKLAGSLLERGLGPDRPLLILSGNSVRHGLLTLAAMQVAVPVVPVSPAYSLLSGDLAKLRHITALTAPGLAYADSSTEFAKALGFLAEQGVQTISDDGGPRFEDLLAAPADSAAVKAAQASVTHDTIAKILFTSGSTGMPKGVINTQRMMLANQQALVQVWPFLEQKPPVLVDWLPWNHTFGGNFNFNQVLRNGGTLYIDGGKPAPGAIDETIRNLRDVSPSLYFNVPRGFEMLLPALRSDAELRRRFFANLDLIFYSAAALPDHLWQGLDELSLQERGGKTPLVSAWGATETAPMVTCVHFPIQHAGVIGLPTPGYDLKFTPNGGKLEMRVRGPSVTPGYWKNPEQTAAAFDAEGYYKVGDAGRLQDPEDASQGIVFDGRTSENFKLTTGTWVAVGNLRLALLDALKPVVSDAVITGHDRDEIGALLFLNPEGCKTLTGRDGTLADYAADPQIRNFISEQLKAHNADQTGSATRIGRVLPLPDMPSAANGEITDKGYINQRLSLELRADAVSSLHSPAGAAILPAGKSS